MRLFELVLTIIKIPLDALMLITALVCTHALRFNTTLSELIPTTAIIDVPTYLNLSILAVGIWIISLTLHGLYATKPIKFGAEMTRIALASTTTFAVIIIMLFFSRFFFASRFIILGAWLLGLILLILGRLILRIVRLSLLATGHGLTPILLTGSGTAHDTLAHALRSPHWGYRIAHTIAGEEKTLMARITSVPLDDYAEVFITSPLDRQTLLHITRWCEQHHKEVTLSAHALATTSPVVPIGTLAGVVLFSIQKTSLSGWGRIAKRIFDITIASITLMITLPVWCIIALLIKIGSPGPVFFTQKRVGREGKVFTIIKFRSMYDGAHKEWEKLRSQSSRLGPVPKIHHDPRVTTTGAWLRSTSLDELPQLINVIKGDMSLVGPRPHMPEEVADYAHHHHIALAIRPGMTGLAQISGRADLNFEDEIRLDEFYIHEWSLKLDIIILLKTPAVAFMQKGAY